MDPQLAAEILGILAGTVSTPVEGYAVQGGEGVFLSDLRRLVRVHKATAAELERCKRALANVEDIRRAFAKLYHTH